MNPTEKIAYNYLLKIGYNSTDITFQRNKSPDFITKDGKRYEVKKIMSGKTVVLQDSQKNQRDIIFLIFNKKNELIDITSDLKNYRIPKIMKQITIKKSTLEELNKRKDTFIIKEKKPRATWDDFLLESTSKYKDDDKK